MLLSLGAVEQLLWEGVVKRLQEVVVETKQGMMVVEKQKLWFVYGTHMSFRQMLLKCSPKTQWFAYVKLLANLIYKESTLSKV